MRKSFPLENVYIAAHDSFVNEWSDSSLKGTEPALESAAPISESEVETLREIECALAIVESERDSGEAIDCCTNSTRRTEFLAAEPIAFPEETATE